MHFLNEVFRLYRISMCFFIFFISKCTCEVPSFGSHYGIYKPFIESTMTISWCSFYDVRADALFIVTGVTLHDELDISLCSFAKIDVTTLIRYSGVSFHFTEGLVLEGEFSSSLMDVICEPSSQKQFRDFEHTCLMHCVIKDHVFNLKMDGSTLSNSHINVTSVKSGNYFKYDSSIVFKSSFHVFVGNTFNEFTESLNSNCEIQYIDFFK
ncbi:hypothetical protein TRFO_38653 [Tritrichomonas foetus]|uniref:Uncharacterized protein n=1 Tax=Tritrichomonas foetus TaxID=1144522 RepID=A0A1J4JCJ2_9EUKA|nr:hypothetical protein TRFO_38653 [Tritrichomonas foetus]|eukprot:OHS95133.1 hypothetical protein TRFO_38653 [Tritrichomonas foetus]